MFSMFPCLRKYDGNSPASGEFLGANRQIKVESGLSIVAANRGSKDLFKWLNMGLEETI